MNGDRRDGRDLGTYPDAELAAHDMTEAQLRSAALTIADRAADAGDCRRLLDMCGLASGKREDDAK